MHAFLSYAREDTEQARRVWRLLTARGIAVWFDEESLRPGQDWALEIRLAIEHASVFLACLSSISVAKRGHVQVELKQALDVFRRVPEGDVFLMPVRFDDCALPPSLRPIHAVDLFRPGGEERLLEGVSHCLPVETAAGHTVPVPVGLPIGQWSVLMTMKGKPDISWTVDLVREAMQRSLPTVDKGILADLPGYVHQLATKGLLTVRHDGRISPTSATIDFWRQQRHYARDLVLRSGTA